MTENPETLKGRMKRMLEEPPRETPSRIIRFLEPVNAGLTIVVLLSIVGALYGIMRCFPITTQSTPQPPQNVKAEAAAPTLTVDSATSEPVCLHLPDTTATTHSVLYRPDWQTYGENQRIRSFLELEKRIAILETQVRELNRRAKIATPCEPERITTCDPLFNNTVGTCVPSQAEKKGVKPTQK